MRIEVDEAKIISLFNEGFGSRRIATIMNVGRKVITRVFRENGLRLADEYWCNKPLIEEHFWSKALKDDNTGCWIWTGLIDYKGYGRTKYHGKRMLAHRLSYQLTHADMIEGLYICHRCDTPACINPEHLFSGDNYANMLDCLLKNRKRDTKLKVDDIFSIRKLYKAGSAIEDIATSYSVNRKTIKDIITGLSWYYVND